jgi:hypothetical protein
MLYIAHRLTQCSCSSRRRSSAIRNDVPPPDTVPAPVSVRRSVHCQVRQESTQNHRAEYMLHIAVAQGGADNGRFPVVIGWHHGPSTTVHLSGDFNDWSQDFAMQVRQSASVTRNALCRCTRTGLVPRYR